MNDVASALKITGRFWYKNGALKRYWPPKAFLMLRWFGAFKKAGWNFIKQYSKCTECEPVKLSCKPKLCRFLWEETQNDLKSDTNSNFHKVVSNVIETQETKFQEKKSPKIPTDALDLQYKVAKKEVTNAKMQKKQQVQKCSICVSQCSPIQTSSHGCLSL